MTPEQQAFFRANGYLLLKAALPTAAVKAVRDEVLDALRRRKLLLFGQGLPASIRALPLFQQITALSQALPPPAQLGKLLTPDLVALMNGLADARLEMGGPLQLLISPPCQGAWTLQGLNWHRDLTAPDPRRVPGVQVFILLDDVQVQGGATLALAGSQTLDRRSEAGRQLRALLRGSADIEQALRARGLSLVEMSGRAGDLYLMDMRLLHSPSVNTTRKPRMMATARCLVA